MVRSGQKGRGGGIGGEGATSAPHRRALALHRAFTAVPDLEFGCSRTESSTNVSISASLDRPVLTEARTQVKTVDMRDVATKAQKAHRIFATRPVNQWLGPTQA